MGIPGFPNSPGPLGARLDDLARRLARIEQSGTFGPGVSGVLGGTSIRATQTGFPAEITAAFSSSDGYTTKRLALEGVEVDNPNIQPTYTKVVTPDGNTSLPVGTRGWQEIDPQAGGWLFIADGVTLQKSGGYPSYGGISTVNYGPGYTLTQSSPGTVLVTYYPPGGYDRITGFALVGTSLRLSWDHTDESGTVTAQSIDVPICDLATCCSAGSPSVTAAVTDSPPWGNTSNVFDFTSTPSGGTAPYTYRWDFDDGSAMGTTQNPTHTYTNPGRYEVTVTVMDACGRTASDTVWVYVHGDRCPCADGNDKEPPDSFTFTLSGGTGDFAGANGAWTLYYIGPPPGSCAWAGDLNNGWSALAVLVAPDYTLRITFTNGTATLVYTASATRTGHCFDFAMALTSSTGTGTTPSNFTASVQAGAGCDLCCTEMCTDYQITGKGASGLMVRSNCTWTAPFTTEFDAWTLSYDGGGTWTAANTATGDVYTATSWDGTGCKTFTLFSGGGPASIEICCAD